MSDPLVFLAKYRRALIDEAVEIVLKEACLEIGKRYFNRNTPLLAAGCLF